MKGEFGFNAEKRSLFKFLAILGLCLFFAGLGILAVAQTNPTPHLLKNGDYAFTNFASDPTITTYPPSMQGWSGSVPFAQPTASTTAQATGDEPLCSGCGTDASTINNSDINGISLQNQVSGTQTGSAFALALALNTTDCYDVEVAWLGVLASEENDLNQGGIQLQYRIGTSGNWTDLNGQSLVWTAGTFLEHDYQNFLTTLPPACDNQPLVQLRWVLYHINNFTFGNRFYLSKIQIMPDSVAGENPNKYCRVGGNVDGTGAQPVFNGYDGLYITEVVSLSGAVTNFDNTSGVGLDSGYSDFSNIVVPITTGDAFDLDIISTTAYFTDVYTGGVYVDWNQDYDFDDPDEFFAGQSTVATTELFASVTVPATAKSGLTRMRVRIVRGDIVLAPCGPSPDGEAEDYTLLVSNPLSPLPDCTDKTKAIPANNKTNVCIGLDSLRWLGVTAVSGYKVSIINDGTGSILVNKSTTTDTAFSVKGMLSAGTTYKWIVEPFDANGTAAGCDTLIFTTSPNADPQPDVLPAFQTSVCQGEPLALDGNPLLGTAPYSTHKWTGANAGLLSSTSIQSPSFNSDEAPGVYRYYYTVTDANGCKGTDSIYVTIKARSEAGTTVGNPTTVCSGGSSVLEVSGSSGTLSWESGLSSVGPWSAVTLQQITSTTYGTGALTANAYYRAVATSADGCMSNGNVVTVEVIPIPDKPVVSADKTVFCNGGQATLQVTNYLNNITWSEGTANSTLVVQTGGSYTATVNISGCTAVSDPIVITVMSTPDKPVVSADKTAFCNGGQATLQVTNYPNNITWSEGTANSTLVVQTGGSYTATVNISGCIADSDPIVITVNPVPAKPIITLVGKNPACDGEAVSLLSSATGGNTWSTGLVADKIDLSISGDYSVTQTNSFGCSAQSDLFSMVFNTNPAQPTITVTGNPPFCDGETVQLSSSSVGDNLWTNGATTDVIDVTASGSFQVKVSNSSGCSSTSIVQEVTFHANPPKPVITQQPAGQLCEGTPVTLSSSITGGNKWNTGSEADNIFISVDDTYLVTNTNAAGCVSETAVFEADFEAVPDKPSCVQDVDTLKASGNGVTYQWFDANEAIAGATAANYQPIHTGNYYVIAYSAGGCASVQSEPVWFSGTGISTVNKQAVSFSVLPNPNNGQFSIVVPVEGSSSYTVVDVTGKEILRGSVNKGENNLNLNIARGTYIFCLSTLEEQYWSKVVIE